MVVFKIEVFNALRTRFGLQNIPLSKQPCKTQPQIEYEDVTWSPQYNMPATTTNKRSRALSLQEVESYGSFLILHIVLETCTTYYFMHKFNMSFVFHFYVFGSTPWIWTNPSEWNSYEGFIFEHQSHWLLWMNSQTVHLMAFAFSLEYGRQG